MMNGATLSKYFIRDEYSPPFSSFTLQIYKQKDFKLNWKLALSYTNNFRNNFPDKMLGDVCVVALICAGAYAGWNEFVRVVFRTHIFHTFESLLMEKLEIYNVSSMWNTRREYAENGAPPSEKCDLVAQPSICFVGDLYLLSTFFQSGAMEWYISYREMIQHGFVGSNNHNLISHFPESNCIRVPTIMPWNQPSANNRCKNSSAMHIHISLGAEVRICKFT